MIFSYIKWIRGECADFSWALILYIKVYILLIISILHYL